MRAKSKRALRKALGKDLFEKSAFGPDRRHGFTGKGTFEKKVRKMQAQLERHKNANKAKLGRIGIPITTNRQLVSAKDIIQATVFEKKLLKKPKTARMLAERLKDTKDAKYFEKIARRAEYNAFMKKRRASGRKLVKMQAELRKKINISVNQRNKVGQ